MHNETTNQRNDDERSENSCKLIHFETLYHRTAHTSGLAQIYGFLTGNYQAISVAMS